MISRLITGASSTSIESSTSYSPGVAVPLTTLSSSTVIGVDSPLRLPLRLNPRGLPTGFSFFFFFAGSIVSPRARAAHCAADKNPSPPDTRSRSSVRICFTFFLKPAALAPLAVRPGSLDANAVFLNGRGASA
jgi:hypothetical protein